MKQKKEINSRQRKKILTHTTHYIKTNMPTIHIDLQHSHKTETVRIDAKRVK